MRICHDGVALDELISLLCHWIDNGGTIVDWSISKIIEPSVPPSQPGWITSILLKTICCPPTSSISTTPASIWQKEPSMLYLMTS